jgi:NADH dehydrogenase
MSPDSSASAVRQLEHLGVEVIVGSAVTDIDGNGVTHAGGRIDARTVIWAAGVAASPLGKALGAPVDRAGRVQVNQDLSAPGADSVFVIGDLAAISTDGKPVPGVSPAAIQEGRHVAVNIARSLRGEATIAFRYRDKGTLATIGRAAAVAEIGRVHLHGLIAWLTWLLVHIFYLIGFRNRYLVISEWAWMYLWNDRGARLITGNVEPLLERGERPGDRGRMLSP